MPSSSSTPNPVTTMTEQERKEKAIREYNELYPKFKAEFDRGSEAITKWLEHQDEPEKAKHYKEVQKENYTVRGAKLPNGTYYMQTKVWKS